jgi:hypothetical protein
LKFYGSHPIYLVFPAASSCEKPDGCLGKSRGFG